MLRIVEEFRRGWADGRTGQVDPGRLSDGARGDQEKTFAELSALADQLNARVEAQDAEIEELRAQITACAGVLKLPGVKTWLLNRFHPDRHPGATDEERKAFDECTQMMNAAYEVVESKR